MSTTNDDEVKPKQEPEKKIFYCEICKVPCMSSISLQSHFRGAKHKKKERAMNSFRAPAPVVYETPRPVKRKLTKDITCLKDFMKDPKREEPLVGLEHVVEIRFEGRKEPHYECKLCYFNTEMAPMIEHLCGYKHRRAYLSDKFPEKMKKNAQEDKVSFLRRVAREIEKTEGLKKYKTEGYTRPSIPSASSSKKKSRWEDDYKSENDPVQKQKALEYLETFRVTSDKEATLVVSITQELTEALKTFCKKKAAINYASSLRPLMSISQDEFSSGKNIQNPSKSYGTYKGNSGNTNRNQDFSSQRLEQAQFTSQLDANASNSFTTASSYSYPKGDGSSSYELRPNDSATVAPLNNAFALQTGGFATGISEWKKQFNQSASVNSQSTSVQGTSPYFTYSGSRYSTEYKSNSDQGNKTTAPDNRMAYGIGGTNWKSPGAFTNKKNLPDQRSSYSASSTYPSSGGYSTNYPLQGCSSYYSGGSANSTSSSRGGSSWSEESRHQKSNFKTDSTSFRSSSSVHNSYRDYQQNRESDKMFEDASALTPNVLHRSQGQDLPSMTRKLKQLTPYYPALQKINIEALVKVLIESREVRR